VLGAQGKWEEFVPRSIAREDDEQSLLGDGHVAVENHFKTAPPYLCVVGYSWAVPNTQALSEALRACLGRSISLSIIRRGQRIEKTVQLNP
jgi:hypothetical protein